MEKTQSPPDLALLRGMPIFGGLDDAELERIWSYTEVVRHGAGELILREGDLAKDMFVLLDGEVEITRDTAEGLQVIGRLRRGDCFGEMALIDIQPRSASVRTLTSATLMVIGFDDLIRVYQFNLQTYTLIVLNIAREISRRLRVANEKLAQAGLHEPGGL